MKINQEYFDQKAPEIVKDAIKQLKSWGNISELLNEENNEYELMVATLSPDSAGVYQAKEILDVFDDYIEGMTKEREDHQKELYEEEGKEYDADTWIDETWDEVTTDLVEGGADLISNALNAHPATKKAKLYFYFGNVPEGGDYGLFVQISPKDIKKLRAGPKKTTAGKAKEKPTRKGKKNKATVTVSSLATMLKGKVKLLDMKSDYRGLHVWVEIPAKHEAHMDKFIDSNDAGKKMADLLIKLGLQKKIHEIMADNGFRGKGDIWGVGKHGTKGNITTYTFAIIPHGTNIARKGKNQSLQINPLKRWIVAEITPTSKKQLAGTFSEKKEAEEVLETQFKGRKNIQVITWGQFKRLHVEETGKKKLALSIVNKAWQSMADEIKKTFKVTQKEAGIIDILLKNAVTARREGLHEVVDKNLKEVNDFINGFGVESVTAEDYQVDNYYYNIIALYINMGDTYDTTIVYDTENNEFEVSSWGDWFERWESEHKQEEEEETEENEAKRKPSNKSKPKSKSGNKSKPKAKPTNKCKDKK